MRPDDWKQKLLPTKEEIMINAIALTWSTKKPIIMVTTMLKGFNPLNLASANLLFLFWLWMDLLTSYSMFQHPKAYSYPQTLLNLTHWSGLSLWLKFPTEEMGMVGEIYYKNWEKFNMIFSMNRGAILEIMSRPAADQSTKCRKIKSGFSFHSSFFH